MPITAEEVLDFWFTHASHWFIANADFDAKILTQFGQAATDAANGNFDTWTSTPSGWLALLVLLDQFPRNIHRGSAHAWAQDDKAQRVALSGIDSNEDQKLPVLHRAFAYLPLEHAEDSALQRRSVALFEALCGVAPADERETFENYLDYARRHRDVIERFGRFPHRNAALGRVSTTEEATYLAQPGAGF